MNGTGNDERNSAKSVPVYRLIDPDGNPAGTFASATEAASAAGSYWPGIEQRDFNTGREGWDIEVVREI